MWVTRRLLYLVFLNAFLIDIEKHSTNCCVFYIVICFPCLMDDISCICRTPFGFQYVLNLWMNYMNKWRFNLNAQRSYPVVQFSTTFVFWLERSAIQIFNRFQNFVVKRTHDLESTIRSDMCKCLLALHTIMIFIDKMKLLLLENFKRRKYSW